MTAADKQLVADLVAAKDQVIAAHKETILVMSDQIDYLRSLVARSAGAERIESVGTGYPVHDNPPMRMHTSEEEDDIESMVSVGAMSREAADAALQVIGVRAPIQLVK